MEVEITNSLEKKMSTDYIVKNRSESTDEETLTNQGASKDCQKIIHEEEVKEKKEQPVTRRGRVVKVLKR